MNTMNAKIHAELARVFSDMSTGTSAGSVVLASSDEIFFSYIDIN